MGEERYWEKREDQTGQRRGAEGSEEMLQKRGEEKTLKRRGDWGEERSGEEKEQDMIHLPRNVLEKEVEGVLVLDTHARAHTRTHAQTWQGEEGEGEGKWERERKGWGQGGKKTRRWMRMLWERGHWVVEGGRHKGLNQK
jgi:hypothetical protein